MIKNIIILLLLYSSITFANSDNKIIEDYKLYIEVPKILDKSKLAKELGAKEQSLLKLWSNEFLIPKKFAKNIVSSTKKYLETLGYFDANVDKKISFESIYLNIKLNKPIRVKSISIKSNFNIKEVITWKKEDVFDSNKFVEIKDNITKKLQENGYCNAKLNTKAYVDLKLHSAKLVYKLDKGNLCYFGKIDLKKYPKDIKKDVIYSRLAFKEGDIFDIRKIEDSYNNLNSLNTFANLQISYNLDTKSRKVDTILSIDKKEKLRRYLFALGVDSEIGFRGKALWQKRNFLGNAQKISIKTQLSKNIQELSSIFFAPAFTSYKNYYFDFYSEIGFYRNNSIGYKEKKTYINSYFNFKQNKFNITTGIELSRLIIDLKEKDPRVIGGTFNLFYPYLSIEYDNRDSKIDPKNGYYFKAYGEYGLSVMANNVQYFKYILEARAIKSYNDLTFSAVGKIGAIHEISGKLPASKLFYAGGLFSNRAYGKDKIGVVNSFTSFESLGGKSFLNLQFEVNYKIYKKFYGALFLDTTMISKKEYDFKGKRLDTIGFGLRYKTPIGPIKIDLGFNMHNKKDYAISIMLGQSF